MKLGLFFTLFILNLGASAFAQSSALFVSEDNQLTDVTEFLKQEAVSDDTAFCYTGNPNAVMTLIKTLAKENENFYCDGCGGGFAFRGVTLIRGIVTYDILIKLEDEVVPGEFRTHLIKPCK